MSLRYVFSTRVLQFTRLPLGEYTHLERPGHYIRTVEPWPVLFLNRLTGLITPAVKCTIPDTEVPLIDICQIQGWPNFNLSIH